jgi:hypothetical protein
MLAERPPYPALGKSGPVVSQLVRIGAEIDRIETEIAPLGRERLVRAQRGRTQSRTAPSTAMSRKPLNSIDLASSPRGGGSKLAFADGRLHPLRSIGDGREDDRE